MQISNEFFDLQIIHSSAPSWMLKPTKTDVRAVLSMAGATLMLLPDTGALLAWKRAMPLDPALPLQYKKHHRPFGDAPRAPDVRTEAATP